MTRERDYSLDFINEVNAILTRYGFDFAEMRNHMRSKKLTNCRREIAVVLWNAGWLIIDIADFMHRNHTSICNLLGRKGVQLRKPRPLLPAGYPEDIRRRLAAGERPGAIARSLGVTATTVSRYRIPGEPSWREPARRMLREGCSVAEVAEHFGRRPSTIRQIPKARRHGP